MDTGPTSQEGSSDTEGGDGDGDGDEVGDGDAGDGDAGDGDEGGDGDGDTGPAVDCDNLPEAIVTELDGPYASGGLTFDAEGNMLGSEETALFKNPYDTGSTAVFVPGMGGRGGLAYLPGGDLAMVTGHEENVRLIHPDGSSNPPWTFFAKPYALIVDQNGMLLVADNDRIYRVDPSDGSNEVLLTSNEINRPRSIGFDADYASLFVGSQQVEDIIYRVYFDGNGELEAPIEWTNLNGADEPWVDGIGVDECDNVYVAEYHTKRLYKVSPDGADVETLVQWEEENYGHAVIWGSGVGGWKDTAIYQPQPYEGNTVAEVDIGVRWAH